MFLEVTKGHSSFLVKRANGVQFSRDPLNLRNVCRSTRKTYSAIVNSTAKRSYRPDLRQDAVARASAIRKSQKPVKADKASKLRGAKALAAQEKA